MFRPRCGRKLKSQSSREALRDARDSILGRTMTTQRGHRQLPTDGRSSPASRRSRSATRSTWPTAQPPPHDDDQVEADPPLAQHDLCQPRGPGSNLGQTTRRRRHGGRPRRPRPSQPCGCRLHRHAPRPHSRRTQRTPEAGHWTPGRSDARTGHRSLGQAPQDTGRSHRTPDTGQERGHGDDSTAGVRTSLAATPSDRTLRRPTVFALSHYSRLLGRSAGQAAPLVHCCPRTITGRA
jgi:hypothetical protein